MEYVTYKKYRCAEEADSLIEQLELNNIKYQIEDIAPIYDITFTGGTELEDKIAVKIRSDEFEKVDKILEEAATIDIKLIEDDHYLHQYTDQELLEILERYDEWNKMDYIYAQKILKIRGKEISTDEVQKLKEKRLIELRKPDEGKMGWLIFGYISAILGGLIGIFIGHHLYRFKKRLPNGERVFAYDYHTRRMGFRIFYIGIASLIFWVFIRISSGI